MSDSSFSRLRWIKPDLPHNFDLDRGLVETAAVDDLSINEQAHLVDERLTRIMEQALQTVGLPIGSTDEARSSPILEARNLLQAASEIEHGLLVEYLYAAYSTTRPAFRTVIAEIAREEMGHLISVQNLLLASGSHPYFDRDDFPVTPGAGDTFPFALTFEPLSLDSLAKYVTAESPPLDTITDAALKARVQPIIDTAKAAAQQAINHVGALYVALYWLFKKDDSAPPAWPHYPTDMVLSVHRQLGRSNWHVGDGDFALKADLDDLQADETKEDWNKANDAVFVLPVGFGAGGQVDRDTILASLFQIASQGEGWELPPDGIKSHFTRFLETFEAFKTLQDAGGPALFVPVPKNPTTVKPAGSAPVPENVIDNPEAVLWGRIFNVRYRVALLKLSLAVASRRSLDGHTVDGRDALIGNAISVEMKANLRNLALELIKMRRTGIPSDGTELSRAAPPFELPKGSLPVLTGLDPDPKIAQAKAIATLRKALKDALNETADLVKQVTALPTTVLDTPSARSFLTDVLVPSDQPLLTALG